MSVANKIRNKKKAGFIEKMKSTLGNVSESCKAIGIDRKTYYNWLESDTAFSEAVEDVYERNTDFVESKLMKLINDERPTAIIFYLKTKGKKRGYVEQTDVNVSGSVNLRPLTDEEIEELRALGNDG